MGGSVSSGKNNDELVDNLVEGGLIKTPQVERVFRAVDRGVYYLPEFRENAYRDLAWREGFFHLSAPCIYSRVMEALELKPGCSFLNIGSGTGYFSTMAGLIIGSTGLNHNIELHKELVDYANKKLIEFVRTSAQFDDFDFCMPQFVNGNVLNLIVDNEMIFYDRIYVGVGVNDEQEQFMKNLLKINGILVMPLNDSLVKIKRIDQETWETDSIMTCSFASLVQNTEETKGQRFNLPKPKPMSLQEICRFYIRNHLRSVIEQDRPDIYRVKRVKSTFNSDFVPKGLDDNEENDNESDNRDDEEEDVNDANNSGNDNDNIFDNIHQLFMPHRPPSTRSNHIQNQLRLMIYGRLLDSNHTSYAIELQRNPDRDNEDDDSDDQQSETENDNDNNATREIRGAITEDEGEETNHLASSSCVEMDLKSDDELKADTQLQISTDNGVESTEASPSESRRHNLLAVVQDYSKSPFIKQSNTIPIPLKMTPENDMDMGRSSESGFRSGSSSSSSSSPIQAKASNSASNSDSESSGSSTNPEGRLLLRKRNYSSDIYSESITADVDDTDDFGGYYVAKKIDKIKTDDPDDTTSPKTSSSLMECPPGSSIDAVDSDEGCMSDDGEVSLSGVKLSEEFKAEQERLKSELFQVAQPSNLMQSKINELPISKILKSFLSYHRKA